MLQESQENGSLGDAFIDDDDAKELEKKYVNQVYEEIADHFSGTRYKPWPKVAEFLHSITLGSLILDVGCGNGKNMNHSVGCFEIGCDASVNLARICAQKNEVLVGDCLQLPFRNNFADVAICIAVIGHISTKERRQRAVKEILRVLRPNGKCLVYVWAMEQEGPTGASAYLKKTLPVSTNNCIEEIKFSSSRTIQVPVHVSRTKFCKNDLLVPYLCGANKKKRFYHLFQEKELESLIADCGARILSSYYDEGNWCAVFEK